MLEGAGMSWVLGLDVSSLSTGALLMPPGGKEPWAELWTPPAKLDYLDRGSYQAERLLRLIEALRPKLVAIEGYSLGSTNGAEPLITVGTIIRYFLRQSGVPFVDVAPSRLKKFVGAQKKEEIRLAVYKRWGYEHESNDVLDAYVLARIAQGLLGYGAPHTKPQLEVLAGLSSPK